MPGTAQTFRFAVSACVVAGIQMTRARMHLLEVLAESDVPMVVEGLVRRVSAASSVHPVTIYRFVAMLEERGIVHRLVLRGQRAVMLACESVDYLICDRCGVVTRISEPEGFREWEGELASASGFRLEHHWFEVSGVCRGCQEAETTADSGSVAGADNEKPRQSGVGT